MQFENPQILILAPILSVIVWFLLRQKTYLGFSTFKLIKGALTIRFDLLQKVFLTVVIFAVIAVLAGPYIEITEKVTYREARDLSIVLDVSYSMNNKFQNERKIETAKRVVREFVENRTTDRIALISFEFAAEWKWPFSFAEKTTNRHDPLLEKLKILEAKGSATDIAKALLTTLDLFDLQGESKGKAIVLVSDGISTIDAEEHEEIASRIEERGIHLYWVWIRSGAESLRSPFQQRGVTTIVKLLDEVGGEIFETTPEDLAEAFDKVGQLETSPVIFKEETKRIYRFQPFLLIALATLVPAIIIELIKEV